MNFQNTDQRRLVTDFLFIFEFEALANSLTGLNARIIRTNASLENQYYLKDALLEIRYQS